MKASLLLLFSFLSFFASAQWGIDALAPAAVCDTVQNQQAPTSFADGHGGLYVYWIDARTSTTSRDIYAQHYDSTGTALWEDQGRLILDLTEDIPYCTITGWQGRRFIAWYAATDGFPVMTDGIYVQELGEDGSFLWEETLLIAFEDSQGALSAGYYSGVQLLPLNENIMVLMNVSTYGYDRIRITGFTPDGELAGQLNGVEIGPLDIGYAALAYADGESAYVYYSASFGMGAAMNVNRVDLLGNLYWPEWVNAADGSGGLGYQMGAIGDPDGITCFWVVGQADIFMHRLDAAGNEAWPSFVPLCDFQGTQDQFRAYLEDGIYTIVWRDGRAGVNGNYALYGQRMTMSGEFLWQEDGIEIANVGYYDPYFAIGRGDEGSVLTLTSSTNLGGQEVVHKTLTDGSKAYGDAGIVVGQGSNYTASNQEKQVLLTGTNIVAVWKSATPAPNFNNLYIARVEDLITYVEEDIAACNSYTYEGDTFTESGDYVYTLPGDTILTLHVEIYSYEPVVEMNSGGLVGPADADSYSWVDCDSGLFLGSLSTFTPTASGNYAVTVTDSICTVTTECVYFPVYTYVDSTLVACESYVLDGVVIEESGFYVILSTGDTIINLTITIESIEASYYQDGNSLIAQPAGAFSYAWIDCATGEEVGQGSVFSPAISGSYAVFINGLACQSLSDCQDIIVISTASIEAEGLELFPNPGTDRLELRSGTQPIVSVRILDAQGRVVQRNESMNQHRVSLDVSALESGLYTMEIRTTSGRSTHRWVKQ